MNFFDTPYFRLNKLLLSSVGLWPFQKYSVKILILSFVTIGMTIFLLPQIMYLLVHVNDLENLFEIMPILNGTLICVIKVISLTRNSEEFKELLRKMYDDWTNILSCEEETQILERYAEIGRKFTLAYSISVSGFVFCFLLLPLAGPVLDIISPLNETRPKRLIFAAEYFMDQEKYYYMLLLNEYVGFIAGLLIALSADTVYVLMIQHICGMYSVLSYRLENLNAFEKLQWTENDYVRKHYEVDWHMRGCIQLHERIRMLIEKMDSTFALFLFSDIGLGVVVQTSACIMTVVRLGQTSETVRYLALMLVQSVRLFFNSFGGQEIADHSTRISIAAYNGIWYDIPVEIQKLLILLIARSQKASQLTVAKLYVINLQGFSTVIRTSVSYCTVMISLRDTSKSV